MASTERVQTAVVAIALLGVAAVAWSAMLGPDLEVDAAALATLPEQIDSWDSVEIPLEDTVEAMLRADFNLQRIYMHPQGHRIELYVGYYGTVRGGRPEHTPWVCYPSGGWDILESRVLWIDQPRDVRANELIVEKAGERHLVQFWYRSHRTPSMVSEVDQVVDRLMSRITGPRADGALIRISTPIVGGDLIAARTLLVSFGSKLETLVAERWPEETPAPS